MFRHARLCQFTEDKLKQNEMIAFEFSQPFVDRLDNLLKQLVNVSEPMTEEEIMDDPGTHQAALDAAEPYCFLQSSICDTVTLTKRLVESILPAEMLQDHKK